MMGVLNGNDGCVEWVCRMGMMGVPSRWVYTEDDG